MKHKILAAILMLVMAVPAWAAGRTKRPAPKVRVACVGNSVTYGYLLPDRETTCYPTRLQQMLGEGYEVGNFGHSGATLLNHGHNPYTRLPEFRQALDFKADLVVIHLGLNDTDPRNWPNYADEFITDYRALIDSFRTANPKAKIWVCLMTPIFDRHARFESGTRDWHALIQRDIRRIAATANVGLIDLHTPLHARPELFADALHPNAEGADILARTVYGALTGDYGGLTLPTTYTDHMVLQRQEPITIEGRANAEQAVTVTLGNEKAKATAGPDGYWSVTLPACEAGGPYELAISDGKDTRTFTDVWVGEVWLCSGQSNMVFKVREQATATQDLAEADRQEGLHLFYMRERYLTNDYEWPREALDTVNHLGYFDTSAGWTRCNAATAAQFSAIAYHFGRILSDSLGCHVGLIVNAVGGSPAEAWVSRHTLEWQYPAILRGWTQNDHLQPWVRERARKNMALSDNKLQRHPYEPTYLFEAGIEPLGHYGLRGVIWYQGESNAHNVELHERLMPMVVGSMRSHFGKPDMPFLFMQLSGIARPSWPHFRDSQRRLAQQLPGVWMTVTSDLGDSLDVHPRQKRPIGIRLAASALHNVYGHTVVVPSGPLFASAKANGGAMVVSFEWGEGLRTSDGKSPRTFELCGDDGIYHAAEARIEGQTVVVSSPEAPRPVGVRYGWQPFTRANLVNAAGLPASTFRSSF